MKRALKPIVALLLLMAIMSTGCAFAVEDGFSQTSTYNYDYWGDVRHSPDAYRVDCVLDSANLGLTTPMRKPESLFVRGNDLYICDTGNNRILQLTREGGVFTLVREIRELKGVEPATLNSPSDLSVDANGNLYIADTQNYRVVMVDKDLNYIKSFTKPGDATFDQSLAFLPKKLVTDVSGRVFCLATNVNKGIIKFEADTTFTGFVGANKVSYTFYDYLWKRFLSTKEQRAQQENFVPTEYENLYMDEEGFIYATNTVFSEYDLMSDKALPIRRLNGIGNDILIKNDRWLPIGDIDWDEGSIDYGPSKLVDITVLEGGIYVAFDKTRGRIFGYDDQGALLWAFGNKGNFDGSFTGAVSIEHMGYDLLCLDRNECSVTVFTPTLYGQTIYEAYEAYVAGDYDGSSEKWSEVLKLNANYNLAFVGVGRTLLRQDRFEEAMEYFKMAHHRKDYGKAYRLYRKVWVEEHLPWALLLIPVIVLLVVRSARKKMKMEVYMHECNRVKKLDN